MKENRHSGYEGKPNGFYRGGRKGSGMCHGDMWISKVGGGGRQNVIEIGENGGLILCEGLDMLLVGEKNRRSGDGDEGTGEEVDHVFGGERRGKLESRELFDDGTLPCGRLKCFRYEEGEHLAIAFDVEDGVMCLIGGRRL